MERSSRQPDEKNLILLDDAHKDKAGVFEGGGYIAKGIYRPMDDHRMMRDYAIHSVQLVAGRSYR